MQALYDTDNPLTFLGEIEFSGGNKVITSSNGHQPWKRVCYHKDGGVYVVINELIEMDPEVGWFPSWTGQKYLKGELVYRGPFKYFYKHTDNDQK